MLTKEYAQQKTDRHIGRLIGDLKEANIPITKMLASHICKHLNHLKKDLTPQLEWENELPKMQRN